MKINSIPTIRFSSIYAISAKRDVMERISEKCDNYSPDSLKFMSATDLYKNNSDGDGFCRRAVKGGDEVAFLVVGEEDCGRIRFMDSGYGTLNGISQHLEKEGYRVDNIEDGERLIEKLMAKENQQPACHQDCANCFYTENADEI